MPRITWVAVMMLAQLTLTPAAEVPVACLVRAKVTSVSEEKRGLIIAKLEITRVYSGPAELAGKTFGDEARPNGDFHGLAASTPFKVDEEGIWILWETKKDGVQVAKTFGAWGQWPLNARSRKGDLRHAELELMAEAVEKVEKEKPEKRLLLLRELACDKTYEVAYWAMTAIGRLDTSDAKKYLEELAMKHDLRLSVAAQIALDQLLCKKQQSDWSDSKPRAEMLRAWATGKHSWYDAAHISSRISNAHQGREIADRFVVEWIRTAADNKDWSAAPRRDELIWDGQDWSFRSRQGLIRMMGNAFQFSASDEARFAAIDWVYDQMRTNDTIELRRAAAETLSQLPLYPKRLKAIEEHLTTEKDDKVAEALRAAIKKAKANDK